MTARSRRHVFRFGAATLLALAIVVVYFRWLHVNETTVALTFLSMARAMSIAGTFFLFSDIAALSAIFVYTLTPEKKALT